jgi:hypothetical protein
MSAIDVACEYDFVAVAEAAYSRTIPEVTIGIELPADEAYDDALDNGYDDYIETTSLGIDDSLAVTEDDIVSGGVATAIERTLPPSAPYFVSGGSPDDVAFIEAYEVQAAEERKLPIEGEVPPTDDERMLIAEADEAIVAIGDEVGVNMRGRIPDTAEHHFFADHASYMHGVETMVGPDAARAHEKSNGFCSPEAGVVLVREADPGVRRTGIVHEKVHGVSLVQAESERRADGQPVVPYVPRTVHIGYTDLATRPTGRPHGLTEWVTEMTANKGAAMTKDGPLAPETSGYTRLNILGDGLVVATATEYGVPPSMVENGLIKGLWTPDRSGLSMIRNVFGDASYDEIVNMPANLRPAEALRLARQFELGTAVQALIAYSAGTPADMYGWQRRRRAA